MEQSESVCEGRMFILNSLHFCKYTCYMFVGFFFFLLLLVKDGEVVVASL